VLTENFLSGLNKEWVGKNLCGLYVDIRLC